MPFIGNNVDARWWTPPETSWTITALRGSKGTPIMPKEASFSDTPPVNSQSQFPQVKYSNSITFTLLFMDEELLQLYKLDRQFYALSSGAFESRLAILAEPHFNSNGNLNTKRIADAVCLTYRIPILQMHMIRLRLQFSLKSNSSSFSCLKTNGFHSLIS